MDADSAIATVAASQLGVFTRAQAKGAGATRAVIRNRLTKGRWAQVHTNVFRLAGMPPSWEQTLLGAWLAAEPHAVVSHRAAARIWELPGVTPDIEITVPVGHDLELAGVRVHHSRLLPPVDVVTHGDLKVTTATRTLIDLSAVLDRATLRRSPRSLPDPAPHDDRIPHPPPRRRRPSGQGGYRPPRPAPGRAAARPAAAGVRARAPAAEPALTAPRPTAGAPVRGAPSWRSPGSARHRLPGCPAGNRGRQLPPPLERVRLDQRPHPPQRPCRRRLADPAGDVGRRPPEPRLAPRPGGEGSQR